MTTLGIFFYPPGYPDPSAAIVVDGRVVSFVEEERLVRNKHAKAYFPRRSIQYVLSAAVISIEEVDLISIGWDATAHEDGRLESHFDRVNLEYPPSPHDLRYQQGRLNSYAAARFIHMIELEIRRMFGDVTVPPIRFFDHHLCHAVMAAFHSGFRDGLVLTIDGSGEIKTTAWWSFAEGVLTELSSIETPHSLGWLYSAFTEYLGFEAYGDEYKVMGLAAYGTDREDLRQKLTEIAWYDGEGGFKTNPYLLSMGSRKHSRQFPDALVEHMGRAPRSMSAPIEEWHHDCAFAVQAHLENLVLKMTEFWVERTGHDRLMIAGGVGLNVKLNGELFRSGLIADLFAHPLSGDVGMSVGSALCAEYEKGLLNSERLHSVYWGPAYGEDEVEKILDELQLTYERVEDISVYVASLLNDGNIVGWFQGGMEAGPRALGARSILADPRSVESRDRVNAVVKFREFWRPFCPSMTEEGAGRYLKRYTSAPFMITCFESTDQAAREIPAVVHVDGTSRVQLVSKDANLLYWRLLKAFEELAGVPVVLNTSFNVKGEPIVCTPYDAVRTFYGSGLDALAIGPFVLKKEQS